MILACVVLVAVTSLAVRTILSLRDATEIVAHTQDVLIRLERLKSRLKDAESAGRGYVLLQRPDFKAAFKTSEESVGREIGELVSTVNDNPRQVERVDVLKPVIARRLGLIAEAISLSEAGRLDDIHFDELATEGLALAAQLSQQIGVIEQQEKTLLTMRRAQAEGHLVWVYVALGGGFVLSLILAGWPIMRLRGEIREREKARRALIESSTRVHDLYERAPCGYLSLSMAGQVTAMNDTLLRWLGRERSGLNRLSLVELCAPHERTAIGEWLNAPGASQQNYHECEVDFLRANGATLPVWLTAQRNEVGQKEWRITVVDITEKKRSESLVARARDQAESIVNTVRQPLILLTDTLHVASANRAFHAAFKTDNESIVGRKFDEICDRQWAVPELQRALEDVLPKQKAVENFELSVNQPKRGQRLFEINATKLYRPGNHTTMTLVAIEDVTVRKQLDDVHRQFRALFESLPGRYLVLSADFSVVAASDAYLAMTMKKRPEILGKSIFEIFPENPDDPSTSGATSVRASLNRVLQNGASDTMAVLRYDIPRPDGSFEERHWSPVNSPVFGADKKVEYIIHRAEDVTEFVLGKKLQASTSAEENAASAAATREHEIEMLSHSRELGSANQQLRALNEELEAFSYSVSHDLRAPLRHIAGFAEMLASHAEQALDDKGRRYLKTITDSAARMGTLIDDLLMFSRMGRAEMRMQKVALSEIVSSVQESLRPEIGGRVIAWEVAPLPVVEGDAAMLRQVFANLLGNAVKYSRKQAEARVQVTSREASPGLVEIVVKDNGAGFDMKYAPKLFGVFQRLHSASEFEGTGVGLAIVRRIVQRHKGNIWADSAPGKGAAFHFTLPLVRAAETPS